MTHTGILKTRFRVLKNGITLEGIEPCDKTFLSCVALHNMILKADQQKDEVAEEEDYDDGTSEEGDDALSTDDEANDTNLQRVNTDLLQELKPFADNDGVIYVRKLSLKYFKSKLIEHHSIQHQMGKLIWPSTNGLPPPANIIEHS